MVRRIAGAAGAAAWLAVSIASAATLDPHTDVAGPDVAAEMRREAGPWRPTRWDELDRTPLAPGHYQLRLKLDARADEAVLVPPCAGRKSARLDGHEVALAPGPVVIPLGAGAHEVVIDVEVSRYEKRLACGEPPRVGPTFRTTEGLGEVVYESPFASRGGGRAVVFIPSGHRVREPSALLVGAHPWNGTIWTYAAYAGLLHEAQARDVLLLMPSGLGNSLYTADAEAEVMRAIDALAEVVAVDPRRISIWGASMGGAGATTIAFHRPDRFAGVVSFFGDSKYDLTTYVRSILRDEGAAHRVNALDVVDNARNLPVWLIHGDDDRTSPVRQSEILATALQDRGFDVRFDRVPHEGHSGALVARFLPEVVARAAASRVRSDAARVTYWSTREGDLGAYGVRIVRRSASEDAFVDVERSNAVHVRRADAVREIVLLPGCLGTSSPSLPPIVIDDPHASVQARWGAP